MRSSYKWVCTNGSGLLLYRSQTSYHYFIQISMNVQTAYQRALSFAALKHDATNEKVKGTNLPYIVHVCNVAMEVLVAAPHSGHFDLPFAIQVALLHDTVEDTETTNDEVEEHFGKEVADGVEALTKNESLPKEIQIRDSVERIKKLCHEIWAVKIADRIANLMPPPADWNLEKIKNYIADSQMILHELKDGNTYLANRLAQKIEEYKSYL